MTFNMQHIKATCAGKQIGYYRWLILPFTFKQIQETNLSIKFVVLSVRKTYLNGIW